MHGWPGFCCKRCGYLTVKKAGMWMEDFNLNTNIEIAGVRFKNPVMTASGTFGSGMEYAEFADLNRLGAVVTKGVANVP